MAISKWYKSEPRKPTPSIYAMDIQIEKYFDEVGGSHKSLTTYSTSTTTTIIANVYNTDTTTVSPTNLLPYFDFDVPRNITVTVGQTGFLHCRVERLGDKDSESTDVALVEIVSAATVVVVVVAVGLAVERLFYSLDLLLYLKPYLHLRYIKFDLIVVVAPLTVVAF
uniref:Ig-like domain-containing protein n=1 Tax=Glossina palpalis gambiensis TaxID=67801 RepID=A0A1B0BKP4_9MUSC